ncbi:MAG: anti-sigma factor [Candidatus Eremiobacteraeota bacterium]|nr:anti-sigma factor [Candidatus Eremiobacteraeota bacterium]
MKACSERRTRTAPRPDTIERTRRNAAARNRRHNRESPKSSRAVSPAAPRVTGTTRRRKGPRSLLVKIREMKKAAAWPAYLVAAACFAIALISSIANISLLGELKQTQRQIVTLSERSRVLARELVNERIALSDVLDSHAHRYPVAGGEVITHGMRIYLAIHALPEPPRGKVYQAWTLEKGSTKMSASPTFLPDARGVALIILNADAQSTSEVAVTLEPEGGSREPTSKPLMDVTLGPQ